MKKNTSWGIILIFLFISPALFGQKSRSDYQLLWKISGNGLKKSSYLFGTMHVRDKKAFDFSDSILVKLEECESFAMESTPDSMISEVFSILMEEENKASNLEEKLSSEEYKELGDKLKNEGYDINKIKTRSPDKIIKLLSNPIPQKGDKETFLDAYLYRIALENNKNIVGLEKIKETMSVLKTSDEDDIKKLKTFIRYEGPKNTQQLIDIYWEGEISRIENYYVGADSTYLENLLYKRNEKMKEKIIELMAKGSTFVAVGAAHLPGEKGLIQLLIKKGYQVTPVNATFTGLAGKYKEKPLPTDWIRFDDDTDLYSAKFPGKPFLYKKNSVNSIGTKIYIYPDLATGKFYYSFFLPMAKTSDTDADALFDQYIKSMAAQGKYKILNKKKITYKNNEGVEVMLFSASEGMYLKMKMGARKTSLYALMLGSYNEILLNDKDADNFFESLELKAYSNPSWESFKSEEGAFTVSTPYNLLKTEHVIPSENGKVEMKMFNTADQNKGINYSVLYYNLSPGIVIIEDSTYFKSSIDGMAANMKGEVRELSDITLAGFPGKSFIISAPQDVFIKGLVFLRASRPYIAFAISSEDKIKNKDVSDFLESFQFIDYKSIKWETYTSSKYNFSIDIPSKFISVVDTPDTFTDEDNFNETFNSIDRNSGTSYILTIDKFSPYDYMEKEEFSKNKHKDYVGLDDSLIWQKDINLNGVIGKEILVKLNKTHNYKRISLYPKGDYQYTLISFIPYNYAETEDVNRFYSSFKFTDNLKEACIFTSKAKLLLTNIFSTDSVTLAKAKSSLYSYNFQKTELPLLYKSIEKSFPHDTNQYWNARFILLSKLQELNDETTIPFLKKLYQNPDTNTSFKIRVLQPLIFIATEESINEFVNLTKEKIPATDYLPYDFFNPLRDSLELNRKIFPKVFHLFKDKIFQNDILNLATTLLDSSAIEISFFNPYKKEILDLAKENLIKKEVNSEFNYSFYSNNRATINFLSRVSQDSEIANYLKSATLLEDIDLSFEAIKGQLRNNYSVETKSIEKIAASQNLRVELYKSLKDKSLTHFYPVKWFTQASFAESSLYTYMNSYDDYAPSKIVLVGSKVKIYKGEEKKFYLFKYRYEDDVWYAGLCGPYSLDKKEIATDPEVIKTGYEPFNKKSSDQHYNDLLKQ